MNLDILSKVKAEHVMIGVAIATNSFAAGMLWAERKMNRQLQTWVDLGLIELKPPEDYEVEESVEGDVSAELYFEGEVNDGVEATFEGVLPMEERTATVEIDEEYYKKLLEKSGSSQAPKHVIDESAMVRKTMFTEEEDVWDYEEEEKLRSEDHPYVIHHEEFFANEKDYTQIEITYFQGDDVMIDDKEIPIFDYSKNVGENLKFGHGSNDPSVVYIRNDEYQAEYSVILHTGSYSIEHLEAKEKAAFDRSQKRRSDTMRFRRDE